MSIWIWWSVLTVFSRLGEGSLGAAVCRVGLLSLLYCKPPSCRGGWFHTTELFCRGQFNCNKLMKKNIIGHLVGLSHVYDNTAIWPQSLLSACIAIHYLLSCPLLSRSIRIAEILYVNKMFLPLLSKFESKTKCLYTPIQTNFHINLLAPE